MFLIALLFLFALIILLQKICESFSKPEDPKHKSCFYRCACGKPATCLRSGTKISLCDECNALEEEYVKYHEK